MAVNANASAMLELVAQDAELDQLGTGFTFSEGPLWNASGYLLFSDMPGDVRRRWDERDGISEVARPSNKGNGMTLDAEGRLLVCEHVTSSLVRMDPNGKNDTAKAHIRVFDVATDGTIANSRVLADGIGPGDLNIGDLVDGMKCDERGTCSSTAQVRA